MPLLLLVGADSHAGDPREFAHALSYPCHTGFPISVEAVVAAGIASTSGCGFGSVSWEGLQSKVEREAMAATFRA